MAVVREGRARPRGDEADAQGAEPVASADVAAAQDVARDVASTESQPSSDLVVSARVDVAMDRWRNVADSDCTLIVDGNAISVPPGAVCEIPRAYRSAIGEQAPNHLRLVE